MGADFRCKIIPGVLFLVSMECTLGVVLTFAFVVGVDEVCVLFLLIFQAFLWFSQICLSVVLMLFHVFPRLYSAILAFFLLRW